MNEVSANRKKIEALEDAVKRCEQADLEVRHHFAHGTYTRELFLPAGSVATGKIHRYSCTNVLLSGKLLIVTDEGEGEISAPHVFVSGENVKKAVYALEDSRILNVHPWNGTDDLEQIENKVIIPPERQLWRGQ